MSSHPRRVMAGVAGTALVAMALARFVPDTGLALTWAGLATLAGAMATGWAAHHHDAQRRQQVVEATQAIEAMAPGASPGEVPHGWSGLGMALRRLAARQREEIGQLERQLKESRLVLDRSSLGLLLIDSDGVVRYANPAVEALFRLRTSPVGRRPLEVLPAVEVHEVVEAVARGEVMEREFATGWGDLVVRAERIDGGTVIARIDDMTQSREAERARSDFVANVSHELRTPITALMGYAETLLADPSGLSASTVAMLGTIERNARRLRDLFEDLLRLHRIETRLKQLPLEQVALHEVLVGAVIDAADAASARAQTFALDVPDGLTAWCNADALAAIVSNLARNAVAYTPDGGNVHVAASQLPDSSVRVQVRDDGIGIAPAHHERVFERFYRVDEARSRRAGGTGLGLAIVKHYALAMGCSVSVDSAVGKGSTFTVTLPPRPARA